MVHAMMEKAASPYAVFNSTSSLLARGWKWAAMSVVALTMTVRADIASDYAEITASIQTQAIPTPGTPGIVAMFGRASFPLVQSSSTAALTAAAAGRYGGSDAATVARAVAFSHTGYFDTVASARSTLFTNSVLWASRQAVPAGTIAVVVSNPSVDSLLAGAGYTVRSVTTTITDANLSGAHVLILGGNTNYEDPVMNRIAAFTAAGGGVVISATPWAPNANNADSNAMLEPFGLIYGGTYFDQANPTVSATAPAAIQSAIPAAEALIADKEGSAVMTAANRNSAANAVFQVTNISIDVPELPAKLQILGDSSHYGTIAPTAAAPINTTQLPVEKMLARYQSQLYDRLTPAELFAHPSAADFPGSPTAGAPTVTKTVSLIANTSSDFYMNQGGKPTRFETGLYAAPGATISVTIPANRTGAGIELLISPNGGDDTTFNYGTWTYFPKLWRNVPLTQQVTQTGHVMGGLLTVLIPANRTLGPLDITISGALPAPAFVLGTNTDAEWNSTLRNAPAPYGYIQNDKLTIYLPKTRLAEMTNPEAVTAYWKRVMDTADDYYGYTAFRKRGEAVATARYVAYGAAYADYPIEAGWGTTSNSLLEGARVNGDWGTYHELGHNFQDIFDNAFVIAIGAEVDVNLFPGIMYGVIHDRTAWDGAHSSYDAGSRLSARNNYLALPAADQTWQKAHDLYPVAYDFYFNLAESFGWDAYRTFFTRLMRYLQSPSAATDSALHALSTSDPNFKRNRFYLLMCDATGRNLDAYFQRYGLGKAGAGNVITQSVKDQIAAKAYPVWNGNTDIDSLSDPGTLSVPETTSPGTEIYRFVTTDAEDPGQTLEYAITSGNTADAFSIDRRTGALRVQKVDAETLASYTLTVQVQDCGVPRFTRTRTFTINVANQPEAPQISGRLFTASSSQPNGTIIGTPTIGLESGRTLAGVEIVAGNEGRFAVNPATGVLSLANAAALPNPGVAVLTLRATDNTGASGFGTVTILCNRSPGIYEERWNGNSMSGPPANTSVFPTFTSTQNVANNYVRRVSGWIVPSQSGSYTFWIAADDTATLSLSTDTTAANKQVIATVVNFTSFQQWTASASQQSAAVFLEAGRAYYLEAVQYDGSGGDHVSVAWQGPGFSRQVIPGSVLIPANATTNFPVGSSAPAITLTAPAEDQYLFVPGTFAITTHLDENTLNIQNVAFYDGETLLGTDNSAPYAFDWTNPLPGLHRLRARINHSAGIIDSDIRIVHVAASGAPLVFITSPVGASAVVPNATGLMLESRVEDDTPANLSLAWSQVSGTVGVVFGTPTAGRSTVRFPGTGNYVLRLTANDGSQSTTADVSVTVVGAVQPLLDADIGAPVAGDSSVNGNAITVRGSGSDIYSTADRCHFSYRALTGDFDVSARLVSKTSSGVGRHAALMARQSLDGNSQQVSVSQENTSTYLMQRTTTGGNTTLDIGGNVVISAPVWMRLVRSGNSLTGYISSDGVQWTAKGPVSTTFTATVLVGFAVSNGSSSTGVALNTAVFDNLAGLGGFANVGPAVNAGPGSEMTHLQASLAGTMSDDALPNPPAAVSLAWSQVSGPGTTAFANAALAATTATFSVPGNYLLRLVADDGAVKTFSEVAITSPASFATWQQFHFGTDAGDPVIAGALADPNHNGYANLLEYAFGSDPLATGFAAMVVPGTAGGKLTLTFPRNTAATDLTLKVEAQDGLDGAWTDLATSTGGTPFTAVAPGVLVSESGTGTVRSVTVTDSVPLGDASHPRRFLRVHVLSN